MAILVVPPSGARAETCAASWYGAEMHGRTASGQAWRPNRISVAHRKLPFGTLLAIRYDGRSIVAPVIDRGPFVRGRCLDLSAGAARALGMRGTSLVSYEIVGRTIHAPGGPRRPARRGNVRPSQPAEGVLDLLFGGALR